MRQAPEGEGTKIEQLQVWGPSRRLKREGALQQSSSDSLLRLKHAVSRAEAEVWMSRRSSSAPASPRDPSEPPPPKAALCTHCTEGRLDADVWVVGGGFGEGEGRACRGPWDPRGRVQGLRTVRGRKRDSGVALGGVALDGGILDKEDGDWVACTDIACECSGRYCRMQHPLCRQA